jgi:hypothetical protein
MVIRFCVIPLVVIRLRSTIAILDKNQYRKRHYLLRSKRNEVKGRQAYLSRTRLPDYLLLKCTQGRMDNHQQQQLNAGNTKGANSIPIVYFERISQE